VDILFLLHKLNVLMKSQNIKNSVDLFIKIRLYLKWMFVKLVFLQIVKNVLRKKLV